MNEAISIQELRKRAVRGVRQANLMKAANSGDKVAMTVAYANMKINDAKDKGTYKTPQQKLRELSAKKAEKREVNPK